MPSKIIPDNQTFADAARSRDNDCLFCSESKSGERPIVSGRPKTIASTALAQMWGIPG